MVRVKICGITNLDDAMLCCKYGADALGFVFSEKSPRNISPEDALAITKKLPPFITVAGLFVNEESETVKRIYKYCMLDVLQFHGDESSDYVNSFSQRKIKAFRMREDIDTTKIKDYDVSAYLFDSYMSGFYGGTGRKFSWEMLQGQKLDKPIILAGGLDPENIIDAVNIVKPYAVDVSSGVEEVKRIKDPEKVKKFIIRAKHGRYEKNK